MDGDRNKQPALIVVYNPTAIAHFGLKLLGSSDPPTSASQVAGTIGAHHHTQLIFLFFVDTGFSYIAQAGLELLSSSNPPTSASQNAGITGWNEPQHLSPSPAFFRRQQGFLMSPRLECTGKMIGHCSLELLPWSPKVLGLQV